MSVEADLLRDILSELQDLNKILKNVSSDRLRTYDASETKQNYKFKVQGDEITYAGI